MTELLMLFQEAPPQVGPGAPAQVSSSSSDVSAKRRTWVHRNLQNQVVWGFGLNRLRLIRMFGFRKAEKGKNCCIQVLQEFIKAKQIF